MPDWHTYGYSYRFMAYTCTSNVVFHASLVACIDMANAPGPGRVMRPGPGAYVSR